jgi:xanthine dehydrogenase accessory factor
MTIVSARAAVTSQWLGEGRPVVAGLLVESVGSSPLEPGALMLIDGEDNVEGSVTGGCVEAAVLHEAQELMAGDRQARLVTYGISDELAGTVGLMCGGTVRILVHELSGQRAATELAASRALAEGRAVVVATLLDGDAAGAKLAVIDDEVVGSMESGALLDASVARGARGMLDLGRSGLRHYGADGATLGADLRVFMRVHAQPPQMVLFGAIDFSAALAPMAKELGYAVTICDAREMFVKSPRFARAAEVVTDWPDRHLAGRTLGPRDAVLVLTHDPKFDEPALTAALKTQVGYIGALGSRRTVEERNERLRRAGVTEEQLARIFSPCGLDLGARGPEETAVSILAEIIAKRTGRAAGHLRDVDVPIHGREEISAG